MTDPQAPSPGPTPPNAGDSSASEVAVERPTFDALPLGPEVRRALNEMGYVHPTPVQLACYDPVIRGKDVVVQARTGTGKTTAFGLPVVDHLVRKNGGLQVLILCPTRELANQVGAEIERLGAHRGVVVVAVYGGAPMGRQIAQLEEGVHVVVGTPGRVLDHLKRGTMEPKNIRALVLDEADEMLSMGFEKELSQIVARLPKPRQTMLFSATVSEVVGRLVREMREPEHILLSGDQVGALSLSHYFYMQQGDKMRDLLRIMEVEDPPSAILFCNTKDETERVARELRRAGYAADYLSGDLEQREREAVLLATREGRIRFMVATDVAARGIDISHLTHVVNVDFPETPEQYVHRTGRTGRAGRTGTAISLVGPKDVGKLYYVRLTYGLRPVERSLPTEQELATRREKDLLARVEKARAESRSLPEARSLARRLLTHEDAEGMVAVLLQTFLGSHLLAAEQAAAERRARRPEPEPKAPETRVAEARSPETRVAEAKGPEARTSEARVAEPKAGEARGADPRVGERDEVVGTSDDDERSAGGARGRDRERSRGREAKPARVPGREAPREPRNSGPVRADAGGRPPRVPAAGEATGSAPADPRGRSEGSRRGGASRSHAELVEWSPPEEADDESPILMAGREGERARAPGQPRREDTRRAGSPSEAPRPMAAAAPAAAPAPSFPLAPAAAPVVTPASVTPPAMTPPAIAPGLPVPVVAVVAPGVVPGGGVMAPAAAISPLAALEEHGVEADDDRGPGFVSLFINVGRRDGVRVADLLRVLAERGSVEGDLVGRIRLRDRNAFVDVRSDCTERSIAAIEGAVLHGRTLRAEVARTRDENVGTSAQAADVEGAGAEPWGERR